MRNNIKILLIYLFLILSVSSFAQIEKGLAVDFGYDERIEDLRNNQKRLEEAYKSRYTKLKQKYNESIELNNSSVTSKPEPTSGYYYVVATNAWDFMQKRQVYVENGVVTKYYGVNNSEIPITQGGKISNFRTVIKLNNGVTCELIFLILFEN